MPPGPHKRRPAKKKKKPKTDKRSSNAHEIKVESMEDSSSGYESVTTETPQKAAKEEQDETQIDKPHNSTTQAKIELDEAAMVEPTTVAEYLSQPFESSPDKGTPKVEDLGFKTPPTGDPVKPVDQSLVEVVSQLNDNNNNTKIQETDDLVADETPLEHTIINETDSMNNQLSEENEVQKSGYERDKESPKSEESLLQDSMNGKCEYCGRSSDDRVNEHVSPECSERQPLLASAPQPPEKASWKNCCGIFELFSGD